MNVIFRPNLLLVFPQVLVPNGWFLSNTKAWRMSFQVSYGSLQFVITPILAPKNGSGRDWQNPSCCRDAKSWELDAVFVTCPGCAFRSWCQSHRVFYHFRTWILTVGVWRLWPEAKNFLLALFYNSDGEIKQLHEVFVFESASNSIQHFV